MSHNRKSTDLPTTAGPHTRGRFDPDTTRMPFLRGNHPSQLGLNSSMSGTPPISLSEWQWLRPVISRADCHPSNNLEPGRTSSSNQSRKRDFSSAFEGLDPSFRQSVEREMNLFPNIPKEARHRFLMKQSAEDFKFHCRTAALGAEWAYDAMIKAEEKLCILRDQLGTVQACLDEERKKKLQADQAQEAAVRRIKELEGKLAALERERQQHLEQGRTNIPEQGRAYREHVMNDNAGLETNVDESQYIFTGDRLSEPADVDQEHEQGRAAMENRVNVIIDLEANGDELEEH